MKLETFIDYGLDFQKRLVPNLDRREVASLRRRGDRFELTLDDGATIEAEKVIIAVGITHYAYIPPALLKLPPTKIAHCSAFRDLSHLAGKDVIVIGAGASAVEVACELARCGAKTRLMTRKDNVRFGAPPLAEEPSFWRRIRHPKSGLGPGLRSWLYCTIPGVFRLLPARLRLALLHHHLGPSAQHHLRETFERDVSVLPGHEVLRAESNGDGVALFCRDRLGDETIVHADYVIAATGYRTDCARLSFIDADMRDAIQHFDGYPLLSPWFELSVSGLFFVGLSSAGSFGPLMRFVYGANMPQNDFAGAPGCVERPQSAAPAQLLRAGLGEPIFLLSGSGDLLELDRLVAQLRTKRPLVGIAYWEAGADGEEPRSIEAMAASARNAIRAYQTHGRCTLVGYSTGGLVAVGDRSPSHGRGPVCSAADLDRRHPPDGFLAQKAVSAGPPGSGREARHASDTRTPGRRR